MVVDFVTGLARDAGYQGFEVVALEVGHLAAALAQQQVLVSLAGGNEGLAAPRLVDALDQVQLLKLFQRAIDADQSQSWVSGSGGIENFQGGERPQAFGHCLDDGLACLGQAVSVLVQGV